MSSETTRNHEITKETVLLDSEGELTEPGWARNPLFVYKRSMIKAPAIRIKEWDYYLVVGKDFAGAFTISDDGYLGLQSVSLLSLDKDDPWEHTQTEMNPFPMGKLKMPESSGTGNTRFKNKRLDMEVSHEGDRRHIRCEFADFRNGKPFSCDITLEAPPAPGESMTIATPWDKKHAFYHNQKINCMRASGRMEYGGKVYEFRPETDFGTLDWGRGVWTYDNTWLWGSGNCDLDGKAFGFNIGYGFGNTKAASENVIFYDGHAHKLDDVTFHIPEDDICKPWTFTSSDSRFEMDFVPILDRAAKIDLKLLVSDQHQVFGRMSGKAVLDDGKIIEIKDVLCFAEKVHNRY